MDESTSLNELFDRFCSSGDRAALGEVFERAAPRLMRHARRRGIDPALADDALQQTFVTVIERRARFDPGRSLIVWLIGIFAVEIKRAAAVTRRRPDPARVLRRSIRDPATTLQASELGHELGRALGRMPEQYRSVLSLRLEHDLAPVEIADRLSASPSTVRVRLHRGLELLRRRLPAGLAGSVTAAMLAEPVRAAVAPRRVPALAAVACAAALVVASGSLSLASLAPESAGPATTSAVVASATDAECGSATDEPRALLPPAAAAVEPSRAASRAAPRVERRAPEQGEVAGSDGVGRCAAPAWREVAGGVGPLAQMAGVFDTARRHAVLFGGIDGSGLEQDHTWLFDGVAWRSAQPRQKPHSRVRARMVFDGERDVAVLFGGVARGRPGLADTWIWNGEVWSQIHTRFAPAPRHSHGMAFDARRGKTLLFGGARGPGPSFADTWEFDGREWQRIAGGPVPPGRESPAMVFDAARSVVVMFGGWSTQQRRLLDDTWEFDGETWREISTEHRPRGRFWHDMCFDVDRGVAVLQGGFNRGAHGDTWSFDGVDWRAESVAGPATTQHVLLYDAARSVAICVGGASEAGVSGTTWELRSDLASFRPHGEGCGAIEIGVAGGSLPRLGRTFVVEVRHGDADLMLVGWSDREWGGLDLPLPLDALGMPGCVLHQSIDAVSPVRGRHWQVTVPDDGAWLGRVFYNQALALDPQANAAGVALSNGARALIGPASETR